MHFTKNHKHFKISNSMKKWIIPLVDIPANTTVERYIFDNTDLADQIKKFNKKKPLATKIDFNFKALQEDVVNALRDVQLYSFSYSKSQNKLDSYQSCSLTWNPLAIDKISNDPHQASLGSSIYSFGSASLCQSQPTLKNSYADSYSFIERTPIANSRSIKDFLDSFKRTLIRSRISKICANSPETTSPEYSWHNDESIFTNLRVNIPIISNEHYAIQIMDRASEFQVSIDELSLIPGSAYAYDTELLHRPYCKKLNDVDRINMVCGVSPWFDYKKTENAWVSNEFYGELHPFDILAQGHISQYIHS